jgi:hypothetical protein
LWLSKLVAIDKLARLNELKCFLWFQTLPGIKKSSVSRCQRQQQPFINENSCGMAPISFSTKNIFTCSCTFQ